MEIGLGELLTLLGKIMGPAAGPIAALFAWLWWRNEKTINELREKMRHTEAEYAASVNALVNGIRWMRYLMMRGHVPNVQQYELEDVSDLLPETPPKL
jgi:hypothetical protein